MSRKEEHAQKLLNGMWHVKRSKAGTFINCESICVAQVNEAVADEIVEDHNKKISAV